MKREPGLGDQLVFVDDDRKAMPLRVVAVDIPKKKVRLCSEKDWAAKTDLAVEAAQYGTEWDWDELVRVDDFDTGRPMTETSQDGR